MPTYARGAERWRIEQDGVRLVIQSAEGERVRKFLTAAQADVARGKLVADREEAGWIVVEDPVEAEVAAAEEPREAELERAILASPDDPAVYAVYGDWLAEQGHPRGELIALQLALAAKPGDRRRQKAAAEYLDEHAGVLLGELVDLAPADALTWRYGFVHRVELQPPEDALELEDPASILDALAHHASGRWLAELELRGLDGDDTTRALTVLAAGGFPRLRELAVITSDEPPALTALPALRGLRRLIVKRAGTQVTDLLLPAMRWLAQVPSSLEALHLRLRGGEPWSALEPLFDRTDLRALRELGLRGIGFPGEALAALAGCPWAAQLQLLDLALVDLSGSDVRALLARREGLAAVRELVISGDQLSGADLAALRAAFPRIRDVRTDADDHRAAIVSLAGHDDRYDGIRE